jgi:hypothetical protein
MHDWLIYPHFPYSFLKPLELAKPNNDWRGLRSISSYKTHGPLEIVAKPSGNDIGFSTVRDFCEYMNSVRQIEVGTDPLTINSMKGGWVRENILNALLLPWGLSADQSSSLECKLVGWTYEITSSSPCVLKVKKDVEISIDLYRLGIVMQQSNKYYYTHISGQKLILMGVEPIEFDEDVLTKTDAPEEGNYGGAAVGCNWRFIPLWGTKEAVDTHAPIGLGHAAFALAKGLPLRIEFIPKGDNWLTYQFRYSCWNHSTPKQTILAAIFIYLRTFHPDSKIGMPDSFKESTKRASAELLKDASFLEILSALDGPEGRYALEELQECTDEEFKAILPHLPVQVASLFNKLVPIAEEELRGGSLFYDSLATAC